MKTKTLIAAAALWLCAGAALAQTSSGLRPITTILCLDVGGKSLPATCQAGASRIDQREDICTCPMGGQRVTAPVCPAGVKPPPESAAYEKARYAAINKGSLVGASYLGKPMCVTARNAR